MANHKGSEGTAKIGSDVIAEVKDWSISESAETIDDTTLGDTARTKTVGLTSASGSMAVNLLLSAAVIIAPLPTLVTSTNSTTDEVV